MHSDGVLWLEKYQSTPYRPACRTKHRLNMCKSVFSRGISRVIGLRKMLFGERHLLVRFLSPLFHTHWLLSCHFVDGSASMAVLRLARITDA